MKNLKLFRKLLWINMKFFFLNILTNKCNGVQKKEFLPFFAHCNTKSSKY